MYDPALADDFDLPIAGLFSAPATRSAIAST